MSYNSETALALGAIQAGVKVITGYPGSPSSGVFEAIAKLREKYDLQMEWSLNEKVACEVAIGASIGGLRSLICTKSVGLNVMIDPLMALNLTPLNSGLVIILGDDPQGYGSQNDQDSRPIAHLLELPLWEPSEPIRAFEMIINAFDLSEKHGVPIIIRETRSFSQQLIEKEIHIDPKSQKRDLIEEPFRFVPVPDNAVRKHKELLHCLGQIESDYEGLPFNDITGEGDVGIITSGFAYQKLQDVLTENSIGNFRILRLETLYPMPAKLVSTFLSSCDQVLVIEESGDFVERGIKVIAWETKAQSNILGKRDLGLPFAGELFRWHIVKALKNVVPDIDLKNYAAKDEKQEYPSLKSNCMQSRYEEVIEMVNMAAVETKCNPIYVGDPGCIFLAGEKLLAKYAIGSAAALASGLEYADLNRPLVAFIGDSGFFHTSIPAIANAVYTNKAFLCIVIENEGALTTGGQPTPAQGMDYFKRGTKKLEITTIAKAIGAHVLGSYSVDDDREVLANIIADGLASKELSFLSIRIPS